MWKNACESVGLSSNNLIDSLCHLEQSIRAKAFRGELVSQDPSDEPASVLLQRIREGREQQLLEARTNGAKGVKPDINRVTPKAKQKDDIQRGGRKAKGMELEL